MTRRWEELGKMTIEQLIKEHDQVAQNTQVGLNYYRDEINGRILRENTAAMSRMTRRIEIYTFIVMALTAINILLVWWIS